MTYDYRDEEDPEVVADVRLREATTRDATRGAPTVIGGDRAIVAQWPCHAKCGRMVGVNSTTLEAWRVFNTQLRTAGPWSHAQQRYTGPEEPLDASAIVYCQLCIDGIKSQEGDECRKYADRMHEIIVELKEAVAMGNATKERELTKKLQGRHPDLNGLLAALRARKAGAKPGRYKP